MCVSERRTAKWVRKRIPGFPPERAGPLSSISEISSVVRIRPRHLFFPPLCIGLVGSSLFEKEKNRCNKVIRFKLVDALFGFALQFLCYALFFARFIVGLSVCSARYTLDCLIKLLFIPSMISKHKKTSKK